MKKPFSSLLLLFTFPVRLLKKSKIDNFVGGLIFGALFSLIVNLATVQVQESINKQRILEAVEDEILQNTLTANNIITTNTKIIDEKQHYNAYSSIQRYTRDIWEQSSEPLQYIAQLDQPTQIALTGYYSITIPFHNRMLDALEKQTDRHLLDCGNFFNDLSKEALKECDIWYNISLESQKSLATTVANDGFEVLNKFHPTKDRLGNWFLRLAMGKESTRVLSGK